jgi:hypothetical protein
MMSWKPRSAFLLLSLAFLFTSAFPRQVCADTYQIFEFTDYDGAGPVLFLDNAGDVVYRAPIQFCEPTANACYSVFQPFGPGFTTDTLPALDYTGTAVFDPEGQTSMTLVNNGFEVDFEGSSRTLLAGPVGGVQLVPVRNVVADVLGLNNFGDVAWTNGEIEENFLAYDLTSHETPEPATFILFTTGLASLAAFKRCRFS